MLRKHFRSSAIGLALSIFLSASVGQCQVPVPVPVNSPAQPSTPIANPVGTTSLGSGLMPRTAPQNVFFPGVSTTITPADQRPAIGISEAIHKSLSSPTGNLLEFNNLGSRQPFSEQTDSSPEEPELMVISKNFELVDTDSRIAYSSVTGNKFKTGSDSGHEVGYWPVLLGSTGDQFEHLFPVNESESGQNKQAFQSSSNGSRQPTGSSDDRQTPGTVGGSEQNRATGRGKQTSDTGGRKPAGTEGGGGRFNTSGTMFDIFTDFELPKDNAPSQPRSGGGSNSNKSTPATISVTLPENTGEQPPQGKPLPPAPPPGPGKKGQAPATVSVPVPEFPEVPKPPFAKPTVPTAPEDFAHPDKPEAAALSVFGGQTPGNGGGGGQKPGNGGGGKYHGFTFQEVFIDPEIFKDKTPSPPGSDGDKNNKTPGTPGSGGGWLTAGGATLAPGSSNGSGQPTGSSGDRQAPGTAGGSEQNRATGGGKQTSDTGGRKPAGTEGGGGRFNTSGTMFDIFTDFELPKDNAPSQPRSGGGSNSNKSTPATISVTLPEGLNKNRGSKFTSLPLAIQVGHKHTNLVVFTPNSPLLKEARTGNSIVGSPGTTLTKTNDGERFKLVTGNILVSAAKRKISVDVSQSLVTVSKSCTALIRTLTGEVVDIAVVDGEKHGNVTVEVQLNSLATHPQFKQYSARSATGLFSVTGTRTITLKPGEGVTLLDPGTFLEAGNQYVPITVTSKEEFLNGRSLVTYTISPSAFLQGAAFASQAKTGDFNRLADTGNVASNEALLCASKHKNKVYSEPFKILADPGTVFSYDKALESLRLLTGQLFLQSSDNAVLVMPNSKVILKKGAMVALQSRHGISRIKSLSGPGHTTVLMAGRQVAVGPGKEIMLLNHFPSMSDYQIADGVKRRQVKLAQLDNQTAVATCDFSIASFLKTAECFRPLRNSNSTTLKQLKSKLLKIAVAVDTSTSHRGGYFHQ